MEQLHISNAIALDGIMDKIGFSSGVKVGQHAADAAWILVQHAISKPSFIQL